MGGWFPHDFPLPAGDIEGIHQFTPLFEFLLQTLPIMHPPFELQGDIYRSVKLTEMEAAATGADLTSSCQLPSSPLVSAPKLR